MLLFLITSYAPLLAHARPAQNKHNNSLLLSVTNAHSYLCLYRYKEWIKPHGSKSHFNMIHWAKCAIWNALHSGLTYRMGVYRGHLPTAGLWGSQHQSIARRSQQIKSSTLPYCTYPKLYCIASVRRTLLPPVHIDNSLVPVRQCATNKWKGDLHLHTRTMTTYTNKWPHPDRKGLIEATSDSSKSVSDGTEVWQHIIVL